MYSHFYGFSEEPFRDTPDPRFLFVVPGHQRALNCLLKGIQEKNGWVLLVGEPGSGKTTLIRHLLESLPEKAGIKTAFIFHPGISFEDLLKEILSELSLSPDPPSGASIKEHFIRGLPSALPSGEILVVFLDEAQDLGLKVLEDLQNFFGKAIPFPERIRLVFSGQPPLVEKLQSQALRSLQEQIKFRCPIEPLTAQEARRYLDHRLHLAGGKSELFTSEAMDLVIRQGEGSPRTLNIICDNALRIGHQLSEPRINAAIVRRGLKEMYAQPSSRSLLRQRITDKSVFRKLLYFLIAVFVLAGIYLLGAGKPLRNEGAGAAKSDIAPPAAVGRIVAPPASPGEPPPSSKMEEEPAPSAEKIAPAPEVRAAAAAPPSPPPMRNGARVKKTVAVIKGATLHSLCWEHYGFANITLMDHIMSLNPEITDPNRIRVHQLIKMPELREENLLQERPGGKTKIFLGTFPHRDFLWGFREEPLLKGREIEITPRRVDTGETWHRFTAGFFADKEEALKTLRALKERGLLPSFGGSPPKGGQSA